MSTTTTSSTSSAGAPGSKRQRRSPPSRIEVWLHEVSHARIANLSNLPPTPLSPNFWRKVFHPSRAINPKSPPIGKVSPSTSEGSNGTAGENERQCTRMYEVEIFEPREEDDRAVEVTRDSLDGSSDVAEIGGIRTAGDSLMERWDSLGRAERMLRKAGAKK